MGLDLHERVSLYKAAQVARVPTIVLLWIYGLPSCAPWGVIFTYFQDYLINDVGPTFPGGITTAQSTTIALMYGVGAILGGVAGGLMHDALWQRGYHRAVPAVASLCLVLAPVPIYQVLNHVPGSLQGYYGALFPAGMLATLPAACLKPMILNTCVPSLRGTALGCFTLTNDVGYGLGPLFVSVLIVNIGGRLPAFNVAMGGWFVASAILLMCAVTIERDVRRQVEAVQELVKRGAMRGREVVPDAAPDLVAKP